MDRYATFVCGALCLSALATAPVVAAPLYPPEVPAVPLSEAQAEDPTPDQVLSDGIERLREFLSADEAPDVTRIREFLSREIADSFDFETMARLAAGGWYGHLDARQRERFIKRLSDLFLSALARNLGSQTRPLPAVEILAPRIGRNPSQVRVPARVTPEGGYPSAIEFRFHLAGDEWKVYDVTANGASAVAFYRGYFGRLIRRQGPQGLLD